MNVRTGEDGLLAALERLMLHQLNAVTIVNQRVTGDTGLLLIKVGCTDHAVAVPAGGVTLTAAPAEGVLEAGRDAEGPVAARGLVSGRDPRTQSRGRDGARSAEGNRGIIPAAG